MITGTVGAGKTAVAREIGELLRLNRVAGGMKMVCGVIDLDALSYVAAGPVEDRFNSNFVLENLKAIWPNYAARGVDHLVLARYVGAAYEVEASREAIPSATVTVCRVTAPPETVQDRCRIPSQRRSSDWHSTTLTSLACIGGRDSTALCCAGVNRSFTRRGEVRGARLLWA